MPVSNAFRPLTSTTMRSIFSRVRLWPRPSRRSCELLFRTLAVAFGLVCLGCHLNDFLNVSPPLGVQSQDAIENSNGAEAVFGSAKNHMFSGLAQGISGSLFGLISELTDETQENSLHYGLSNAKFADARRTAHADNGDVEPGNGPFGILMQGRSELLIAEPLLAQYEPESGQHFVGEAFALLGYTELFLAEDYCAGIPLDQVLPGSGGIQYGTPLTTDSLFGVAEAHFDSALANAHGDANVISLASVGLGRVRLDRGHFAEAKAAVALVPVQFVYNIVTNTSNVTNLYYQDFPPSSCGTFSVSDREGGNGLDFISAHDPRLVIDSTSGQTCDLRYSNVPNTRLYYPTKFGSPSAKIPMATGIEARLIEAEADLHANNAAWLADLNTLRTTCAIGSPCANPAPAGTGGVAGLAPLTDPGSANARIDLVFRERAFWLFGTGTRLGDLRRLIRQYGRSADTVFPAGAYGGGLIPSMATYGTDVSIGLPSFGSGSSVTNPNYVGCLNGNSAA